MENAIKYYYSISPLNLQKLDNGYIFDSDYEKYYLELSNFDEKRLKEVYELNRLMISNNILVHEIILNSFKQLVTIIDDKPYVLMRINVNLDKKIDLKDISYFQYSSKFLINEKGSAPIPWNIKWSKKIDHYEQQATEIGKRYPIAMEAFNYFVGIAENAVMYVNEFSTSSPTLSYCHIRPITNALEFYNPFNLIIDYKVRDVSEYLKFKFFYEDFDFNEFSKYLYNSNLTGVDIQYFYARMLFPTYFFDVFEQVMETKVDEKKISYIVKKISDYESLIRNLYYFLNKYVNLDKIDWLIRN